jgi:hypothetical protein
MQEITTSTLAAESGKDRRTIQRALRAAGLKPIRRSKVAGKVVAHFERRAALAAIKAHDGGDYAAAIERRDRARAAIMTLKTQIRSGDMLAVSLIEDVLQARNAASAGARKAIPGRIAREFAALNATGLPESERRKRARKLIAPHAAYIATVDGGPITWAL